MTRKLALLAVLAVAACAPTVAEPPSEKLVYIRVEAPPGYKFERALAAAQPVANQGCPIGQQASWVATTSEPGSSISRFMFVCR